MKLSVKIFSKILLRDSGIPANGLLAPNTDQLLNYWIGLVSESEFGGSTRWEHILPLFHACTGGVFPVFPAFGMYRWVSHVVKKNIFRERYTLV